MKHWAAILIVLILVGCRAPASKAPEPDLAAAAADVYAWLQRRHDAGEQITPGFVQMLFEWSRRWCLAELDAASTALEKQASIDRHIKRLTSFKVISSRHPREDIIAMFSTYFVREAELWRAELDR